jgi:diguanylate cyclase (GGDEF)-like protein
MPELSETERNYAVFGLKALFSPMPADRRDGLMLKRRQRNHGTLMAAAILVALFAILLEIQNLVIPGEERGSALFIRFSLLYGFLAAFCLMYLVLSVTILNPFSRGSFFLHWFFAVFLMGGTILLTWLELHGSRNFTAFQIGLFGLGLSFSAGPAGYAILLLGGTAAIQALALLTPDISLPPADYVTASFSGAFAFILALIGETQRRRADEAILRHQAADAGAAALTDPATGTYSRGFIMEALSLNARLLDRPAEPFCLISIVVESYASIIRGRNRVSAEAIDSRLAAIIKESLRPSDIVGRIAEDEFIVILPISRSDQARSAAERIVSSAEKTLIPSIGTGLTLIANAIEARRGESAQSCLERARSFSGRA